MSVEKLHDGYYKLFKEPTHGHTFLSRKDKPYIEGDLHPDCVVVQARDDEGRLLVIREFRPILNKWIWALPAGKIDPGESLFDAAIREVKEESGLNLEIPDSYNWYSHTFASPGLTDEIVGIVQGVVSGTISSALQDKGENIESFLMSPDDMLRAGLHKPGCPQSIWLALSLM